MHNSWNFIKPHTFTLNFPTRKRFETIMKSNLPTYIFVGIFSVILGKTAGLAIPVGENSGATFPDQVVVTGNNNGSLARQGENPSAVDNIEDAILAALEAAQIEEATRPPTPDIATSYPGPSTVTQGQVQAPQQPQYQPQHPLQQLPYPLPPGFGHGFPPIGHPGSLLWSPLHPLTATGSPVEYFGGIVGNLAGVADNTLKLVGSSTNALLGVAGHVSCTLNPMCAIKG